MDLGAFLRSENGGTEVRLHINNLPVLEPPSREIFFRTEIVDECAITAEG
jgi:hypothetical protein